MINSLTDKQKRQLKVYRDKWLAIGLSTDRIDRKKAKENFYLFNKLVLGNKKRQVIVFMDSPQSTWVATCLLYVFMNNKKNIPSQVWEQVGEQVGEQVKEQVREQVGEQVGEQVKEQVKEQVMEQVWEQVGEQVKEQVGEQVGEQVKEQVMEQVWEQVREQVGEQVGEQVKEQVKEQVGEQVKEQVKEQVREQVGEQVGEQVKEQVGEQVWKEVGAFVYSYLGGQFDSPYFSFYDYFNKVLHIEFAVQKNWDCYLNTSNVSLIYPLEEFCVISEKPTSIKMKNGILHNETGAAISYADGFSVYALNGVRVSQSLVETSAENLDPKLLITEKNAEVRREIIRKIGISRILQKLEAKKLDSWKEYELFRMENIDIEPVQVIKMICPSTGVFHAHRVPPQIETAREGIRWINHGIDKEEFVEEK